MSTLRNLGHSNVPLSRTDISKELAEKGNLFSQTGQFLLQEGDLRVLVHLPFANGGGPLNFDYQVFSSINGENFTYFGSVKNNIHQGSSGQDQVFTGSTKSVVVADSGKEWTGRATEELWSRLGYDYMNEPPQDYVKWPLGFLVHLSLSNQDPYIVQKILTDFRSFNHSVSVGDTNADGIEDYLVSGVSNSSVDPLYWSRIGYLVQGSDLGFSNPIWIDSPNLSSGVSKFGMSGVSLSDVTGDGRDEAIFSGGSSQATRSDDVIVVYDFSTGQPVKHASVKGYGKFLGNPGYNHYMIDFDRDGDEDLLVYFGVGRVGFELLENTGGGIFLPISGNLGLDNLTFLDFKHVQVLDFNSDGFEDIVLDNLSYEFNLSLKPQNLSKAFIQNNGGHGFTFVDPIEASTGGLLSADYRPIASSFTGYVGGGSYQYVTSYVDSDYSNFGVFTQNITFENLPNIISGSSVVDNLSGTEGRDVMRGLSGDDLIEGGGSVDTVVLLGKANQYRISKNLDDSWQIEDSLNSRDGSDHLVGIERLQFADRFLAIDIPGNAGQVAKLLGAVFGAESVSNVEYVGIGLKLLDGGMSYTDLATLAVSATGKSLSTDVCNLLWENVIGSPANAADIAPFKAMLDSNQLSVGQLTTLAADTSFNAVSIDLVGLAQTGLEYV